MDVPFADTAAVLDAARFGAALLLKAAVLLGIAWALAWWLRHRSAALRHGVWSLAVALALLLPLLSAGLPAWHVALPEVPWRGAALERPAPVASGTSLPQGVQRTSRLEADPMTDVRPSSALQAAEIEAAVPKEAASPRTSWLFGFYALAAWSGGAALLFAWLALHLLRVRRLTRRARPDPTSVAAGLMTDVRRRLGIRPDVRLLFSEDVAMPVTWGLWRPVVLLPADARAWPANRLRVVLLHEGAHVARRDYLAHLAAEVACALYWPNPLVWIARSRVRAEQEQACDDRVLRAGTRSYEYAEHLLEVVRAVQSGRPSLRGAVAMAHRAGMKERIRAILDVRTSRRPLTPQAAAVVVAVLAGFAVPVAALNPQTAAEEAAPPTAEAAAEAQPSQADTASFIWAEAESGAVQAPMTVQTDLDASSGRYVAVPDGEGNDAPEGGEGHVAFEFEVERAGEYVVWARVIGKDDNDNSFYVSMGDGPERRWDVLDDEGGGDVEDWTWLPVAARGESGVALRYRLGAGAHTLRVRNREDGTRLDRVLVTSDLDYVPQGRGPAPTDVRPVYAWVEAEAGGLAAPMDVREGRHASGYRYVQAPKAAPEGEGTVTFAFEVAETGPYVVWGRILAPDDDENSFFVSLGEGEEVIWDVPKRRKTSKRWTWDPVSARRDGETVNPVVFNLEPGRHMLRVRNRESGTRLDGVLVTNDLGYRPRGTRPALPPAQPVYAWLEAEAATHLEAPLRTSEGDAASGGRYVEAGGTDVETPPSAGHARYAFEVVEPGVYTVWGRVGAEDGDADSFWIRVDEERWIRWNGVRQGKRWRWDEVHDSDYGEQLAQFELDAGPHTLEVAHREGGVRLDKLLVTNDPHFRPEGEGGRTSE